MLKTRKNGSKFTTGKYINAIKIIKPFPFMPVSNFPWLNIFSILQKEALSVFWSIQGVIQRNQGKTVDFPLIEKGRKNTNN